MMDIPFVAADVDVTTEPPSERELVDVPHATQLGITLRNGCGYATEKMKALWLGKPTNGSIEYWKSVVDTLQDGSTAQDLGRMDKWYGFTPVFGAIQQYPFTTLIYYRDIPPGNQAPGYIGHDFGHWVLVVGSDDRYDYYHDPLWRTSDGGANLRLPKGRMDTIDRELHRVGVVERPYQEPAEVKVKYKAKPGDARVRTVMDTTNNNNIVGLIGEGAGVFDGEPVLGQSWIRVQVKIGSASVSGIPLTKSAANDDTIDGYISLAVVDPA